MATTSLNWSWIADISDTKNESESIDQNTGTVYPYRHAQRGILDSTELNASMDSIISNVNHQWRIWRSYTQPVLDSLPAGPRDERWRTGIGLPTKIDALTYGIQGTTLFVFNDASSSVADGRYWHTEDERPKTIAESIEDLWYEINELSTSTTTEGTSTDLSAIWAAIGNNYEDSSLVSLSSSLDARTGQLESNISQLTNDLYGSFEGYLYGFGNPLSYSFTKNIEKLLQLHGVSSWQDDPSGVTHSGIPVGAHTHPYTNIIPMPSSSLTQGRTGPYTSLYNDILRLRYEIKQTRGSSSWFTDVTDPVTSSAGNLGTHINYTGTGSSTSSNPHGINYIDTGANVNFANLARFVGMNDYTSSIEMPNYSSTYYLTNGTSLETAISDLDATIYTLITTGGTVIRMDYSYDRSGFTEEQRLQNPIIINHGMGKVPLVNVFTTDPIDEDYWGIYIADTEDVDIEHPDTNTMIISTTAAKVQIVAMF